VGGDGHGTPIGLLTQIDTLPYLAHAMDAPVERLGTRAPERPVWVCSIHSDPRHRDLTDPQWAEVTRRAAAVTIAPDGTRTPAAGSRFATGPCRCASWRPSPASAACPTPRATPSACRASATALPANSATCRSPPLP
jgi:hypothetical protein